MTFLLGLFANRYARIGLGILAAVAVLLLAVKCVRDDAARDERARQEAQIQRDKAAQREREWQAEESRRAAEMQARVDAAQRQKEFDNANSSTPDKAPSPRQRRIACAELRREAQAAGRAQPAC